MVGRSLGAAYVAIKGDNSHLKKELAQSRGLVATAATTMGQSMLSFAGTMAKVGAAAATIGAGFAAWKAFDLSRDIIRTGASFEQLQIRLETIKGSSEAAKQAMDWITDFTAKTPYQLQEVTDAFTRLEAFGLDATKNLGMLGDTASAMGKGILDAVEMYTDALTGEFERLKEFGVKARSTADEVTFAWTENGKQMEKTVPKTAESIAEALNDIFDRFNGAMEDQSRTFNGLVSNIMDQWDLFKKKIAESGVFQYAKQRLEALLQAIERLDKDGTLTRWAISISNAMEKAGLWVEYLYWEVVDAIGPFEEWGKKIEGWKRKFEIAKEGVLILTLPLRIVIGVLEVIGEKIGWLMAKFAQFFDFVREKRQALVEFMGSGSATMPLSDKIDEMQDKFSGMREHFEDPIRPVADFSQVREEIASLAGGLGDLGTLGMPMLPSEAFSSTGQLRGPAWWHSQTNSSRRSSSGSTVNVSVQSNWPPTREMVADMQRELEQYARRL